MEIIPFSKYFKLIHLSCLIYAATIFSYLIKLCFSSYILLGYLCLIKNYFGKYPVLMLIPNDLPGVVGMIVCMWMRACDLFTWIHNRNCQPSVFENVAFNFKVNKNSATSSQKPSKIQESQKKKKTPQAL